MSPAARGTGSRAPRWSIARRRLIALAALAALLLAGYWFWLRDSSLVAVDEVEVRGATTDEAEVTAALEEAAKGMTTLNVDEAKLVEAVSAFPTVASIATDAGLPDKLTITVTERLPVGVVKVDGEPIGVSADGLLLPGAEVRGRRLPVIEAEARAGRLDAEGADQAAILGAAPAELRERIEASGVDPEDGGVVLDLEDAPEARFGDGSDAEAKWRALAAVLLSPETGSPAYVDVSVPERPVSGG
jgi:cell division protein FtsQ